MNHSPSDHTTKPEIEQAEPADREVAAKLFGTITPPRRIPFYPGKPDQEGAFAWVYCSRCIAVVQINREKLAVVLKYMNLLMETNHALEGFDPEKQYILADGCPNCRPDGWIFAVDEFPVGEGRAGAGP